MEKKWIKIPVEVYDAVTALPQDIQNLMQEAHRARELAYAPYSHFKVGAAVLLKSGEMVMGNNQENAAFPSGLCAERVAIYHAGANYPQEEIVAIAITARSENHKVSEPIAPCGACRQSLAEYEQKQKKPIAIYFMGEEGRICKIDAVSDLLPLSFDARFL